ncbi:MAG: HD domain-containing protein [Candidatus Heimdallarchaeota archaeon]
MSGADLLSFLETVYSLKQFRRQGWIRAGVPISDVETVAEHTFGVAILTLILFPLENRLRKDLDQSELNFELALNIAIAHDLAECKFQDWDTSLARLIGNEKFTELKQSIEEKAFLQIQQELAQSVGMKVEMTSLLSKSPEASFIQEIDKLDVILQAQMYIKRGLAATGVRRLLEDNLVTLQEPNSLSVKWFLNEIRGDLG